MADKSQMTSNGGQYTNSCAANTASIVSSAAGRICKIITLGNLPNSTTFYDNSTGAGGTQLFVIPANTAVGTIYDVQLPVANGIYYGGAANTPACIVSYNLDTAYGR